VLTSNHQIDIDTKHRELVAEANACVAKARGRAEQDPLRPIYHLTTPAYYISDPHGSIFYNGEYHVFFQQNPFAPESIDHGVKHRCWAHAASKDLVHWEHWPIAIIPNPGSCDQNGTHTGSCVVHEGVPSIIYTGVSPEVQCLARSNDGMRTWQKYPGNPVIGERPRDDLIGFRDPFVWKEQDTWYMVIGSGIRNKGGAVLLYDSKDLVHWEYMHPLCAGWFNEPGSPSTSEIRAGHSMAGRMWECPNFFPLGDKHMLIVSSFDDVKYSIGTYENHIFTPGPWHTIDMAANREDFYAPNTMEDPTGRRIMWGWTSGGGTPGYPWNGVLTLPRMLSLRPDGRLGMEPLPELKDLRGKHNGWNDIAIAQRYASLPTDIKGGSLEILTEIRPGDADVFGIVVGTNTTHPLKIGYDQKGRSLFAGDRGGKFDLVDGEETLSFHIFVDMSVIEAFANRRACITTRFYPEQKEVLGLSLFARGGAPEIRSVDLWEVHSIW